MFGARMRTTLARRLVSIDTASCLRTSLQFNILKTTNEEEALQHVAETDEIETDEISPVSEVRWVICEP